MQDFCCSQLSQIIWLFCWTSLIHVQRNRHQKERRFLEVQTNHSTVGRVDHDPVRTTLHEMHYTKYSSDGEERSRASFRRWTQHWKEWRMERMDFSPAGEIVCPSNNVFFFLQVLLGHKANNADILLKYEQSLCLASQIQRSVAGFELTGQRLHRSAGAVSLQCPAHRLSFWLSSVSLKSWPEV